MGGFVVTIVTRFVPIRCQDVIMAHRNAKASHYMTQPPKNRVLQGNCAELLKELPDNSIDLILTDPPYYKVKKAAWDNQWSSKAEFIEWLRGLSKQWQRVLKPNGSLYCFCSTALSAHTEVMLGESFNVLNNIRWRKLEGRHKASCKEGLRGYFPASESIIFCEHYNADNAAKGEAGYQAKCDELRGFVFEPLRAYLDGERLRAGVAHRKVIEHLGMGGHDSHFFSPVQWKLPLEEQYLSMRSLFGSGYLTRPYEELRQEYEELRQEYEELRQEYEELRRPFFVSAEVPYTDVWTFPTVSHYPGKHLCEKPAAMLEHIIAASSKPGALVLDCFGGSGATGIAAQKLGRNYLLFEMDEHWVNAAREKLGEPVEFAAAEPRQFQRISKTAKPKKHQQLSLLAS